MEADAANARAGISGPARSADRQPQLDALQTAVLRRTALASRSPDLLRRRHELLLVLPCVLCGDSVCFDLAGSAVVVEACEKSRATLGSFLELLARGICGLLVVDSLGHRQHLLPDGTRPVPSGRRCWRWPR